MANYTLLISRHYSGLFVGHCLEEPGISVMGEDHEEVEFLIEQALASELSCSSRAARPQPPIGENPA